MILESVEERDHTAKPLIAQSAPHRSLEVLKLGLGRNAANEKADHLEHFLAIRVDSMIDVVQVIDQRESSEGGARSS